jgi:phospholipid/cholesterol/gamma-HCH transport system substrate-binding protein
MKLSKTSRIGLWIVFTLIILVWGFNFLKGRNIFKNESVFYARYSDVSGLTRSTIVTLNGFKIGYVRQIYFAEDLSGDLIVQISIQNKFPLPVGSSAEIASTDLLGSRVMKINLGHSNKFYQPKDTLLSKVEFDLKQQVGEQLGPIKAKAERLLVSLDSIVSSTSRILNPETQKDIINSIDQFGATMANLNKMSKDLSEVIGDQKRNLKSTISNLSATSENLKQNSEHFNHIMKNISGFSDSLAAIELNKTFNNLNSSIKNLDLILGKIQSTDGTLGMLVNDPSMYQNLNTTVENLRALLIDFRQNPKRYVHFSAFDLKRDIIVNPSPVNQDGDSVIFKVLLFSSPAPVDRKSSLFKGLTQVEEVKTGKFFNYFTGQETSLEKVREILHKAQSAFPEASLKAFQKGKEISLKKAIKSISK